LWPRTPISATAELLYANGRPISVESLENQKIHKTIELSTQGIREIRVIWTT